MERKIGEIFTYGDKRYQVVGCENCDISGHCISASSITGSCWSDNTNIIFKEINNMEIKNNQLTIDIL